MLQRGNDSLYHVGKDLREIQKLPGRKISALRCYSQVGYEQTRQTAEALSKVRDFRSLR